MKRLTALVLLLCMSFSLFSGSAWASEEAPDEASQLPIDISTCTIYTRPKDEAAFYLPSALVMVYDGEKLLRNHYDYSITSHSDMQDDGSMIVTVTGIGDYMFHYRTKLDVEPFDRVFRNFSVEDAPEAFHAQADYGEEYAERYATLADLSFALRVKPDPWSASPGKGYQDGVTVAFDFQDDNNLWYLGNAVYKTVYRFRELRD